jgi:5-methylcytosine-specific restriction endonuclease McrA
MPIGCYVRKASPWNKGKTGLYHPSPSQEWRNFMSRIMTGRKHSESARKKMSLAQRGRTPWNKGKRGVQIMSAETTARRLASLKRHYDKVGRKTDEGTLFRNSPEYKAWRKAVFERDDYRCYDCGDKAVSGHRVVLNADHIYPFALYPRLRLMLENGRTLCAMCHRKTPTFARKVSKLKTLAITQCS